MRRLTVVAALTVASSCGGASSNAPRLTAKDIVKRSSPAIVRIDAGTDKVGTGFILDKAGLVATNLHVVLGESAIKVRLFDGSQYPVMQIAGIDVDRDLALLKINPSKGLPTLKLGDSDAVAAGDQIIAIGNQLGEFDYSVTSGLVSQVRHACDREAVARKRCPLEFTLLQISAPISLGSSGGPLFNQTGEVVGVTTAIITAGQNLNFAVPGNYLKPLMAQPAAISLDQFARETKVGEERHAEFDSGSGVHIVRKIPTHELSVFDGCKIEDIEAVVREILEAIDNGAPLYNDGKHEACFRIYEGTAVKYEQHAACSGVRAAFGDGLLRANELKSYTEKAWAMRDTFDGLLDAAKRWADKHPQGAPGKPGRPKPARPPKSSP